MSYNIKSKELKNEGFALIKKIYEKNEFKKTIFFF